MAKNAYGMIEPAKVVRVDARIGRVFVEFTGGLKKTLGVAFGDLTVKLP